MVEKMSNETEQQNKYEEIKEMLIIVTPSMMRYYKQYCPTVSYWYT